MGWIGRFWSARPTKLDLLLRFALSKQDLAFGSMDADEAASGRIESDTLASKRGGVRLQVF